MGGDSVVQLPKATFYDEQLAWKDIYDAEFPFKGWARDVVRSVSHEIHDIRVIHSKAVALSSLFSRTEVLKDTERQPKSIADLDTFQQLLVLRLLKVSKAVQPPATTTQKRPDFTSFKMPAPAEQTQGSSNRRAPQEIRKESACGLLQIWHVSQILSPDSFKRCVRPDRVVPAILRYVSESIGDLLQRSCMM
eukprot:2817038-Amphidinium_carterae.1